MNLPVDDVIFAVGDVHGCPNMLRHMLGLIRDKADAFGQVRPKVIFLGDLIDRGPDSRAVLELLSAEAFTQLFDATFLRGNHEAWLLDALAGEGDPAPWMMNGGAETIESYGIEFGGSAPREVMRRFARAIPRHHLQFLARTRSSLRMGSFFFCHAGIRPGSGLQHQVDEDLLWIRDEFLKDSRDHGALVVHGHTPTATGCIEILSNRVACDTGCGFPGGRLSAAAFLPSGLVQVLQTPTAADGCQDLAMGPQHA